MAHFHDAGSMTFDALVYGRPHAGTLDFLQRQFETPTNRLTQYGQQFMQGAHEMFERISSSRAIEAMRQAARSINSVWDLDEIRPLTLLSEFQYAPPSLQRFIMAEPTVRQMYLDQTIEGYTDSYVDMQPNATGDHHYDYQRAMNGLVVENESDAPDDSEWSATTYFGEIHEDDNELSLSEQVDIQYNWQWLRRHLAARGEDPTSRYSARMV